MHFLTFAKRQGLPATYYDITKAELHTEGDREWLPLPIDRLLKLPLEGRDPPLVIECWCLELAMDSLLLLIESLTDARMTLMLTV